MNNKLLRFLRVFTKKDDISKLHEFLKLTEEIRVIPINLVLKANKQSLEKKPILLWKNTTVEEMKKEINDIIREFSENSFNKGVAVVLEDLNLAVIDIDDISIFEHKVMNIKDFIMSIKDDVLMIEKSLSKGWHFYLPKEKILNNLLNQEWPNNRKLLENYGFEIRYQGLIIVPPSKKITDTINYSMKTIYLNSKINMDIQTNALQTIINFCNDTIKNDYIETPVNQTIRKTSNTHYSYKITNDILEEIKATVSFREFMTPKKTRIKYDLYSCPFHQPDRTPSFIVYKNPNGEIGFDAHDYQTYDIISFIRKYYNLSFQEAVFELAERSGISLKKEEKTFDNQVNNQMNMPMI